MLIALVTIRPNWRWLPGVLLAAMLITSLDHFYGGRWTQWSIETAGDRTYRLKVPPGLEMVVVDRLHQPAR